MARAPRAVHPWEKYYSCPTCHVRPGERCVTTKPLHMQPDASELARVGSPTSPHQARVNLWLSHQGLGRGDRYAPRGECL